MARITTPTNTLTSPQWAAEALTHLTLVPGGARLNAADFTPGPDGIRRLESGEFLGRTFAERTASTGFGPWTAGDEENYIAAFDVTNMDTNADVALVRHATIIYENWLPGPPAGAELTALQGVYEAIVGQEVA